MPSARSQTLALDWMKERISQEGALPVSNVNSKPYPEVTGYSIPTLLRSGERGLALKMARWLLRQQRSDGSFAGIDGEPQIFDTAQVVRGLLALGSDLPGASECVSRAAEWMLSEVDSRVGCWIRTDSPSWVGVPEAILLYTIWPLERAISISKGQSTYADQLAKIKHFYAHRTRVRTNSHFLGYIAAGLQEIGLLSSARRVVRRPHRPTWPGTAQLAEVHFRLGEWEAGEGLLRDMANGQQPSGGWTGGAPDYFDREEVSWAPKFYLDACAAMREAWFVRTASRIPSFIDRNDERLRILLELAGDVGQRRILDVGCGKGRYLWYLQNKFPRTELHACDISSELLQSVPLGVRANVAPVTLLPYPDNFFDLVVCVEALEHAVFIEQALAELRRVTKPGGRLLVIDKDRDAWGTLPVAPWEQWFEAPFLEHSVKLRMDRGLFRAWYEDLPRIKIETSS